MRRFDFYRYTGIGADPFQRVSVTARSEAEARVTIRARLALNPMAFTLRTEAVA